MTFTIHFSWKNKVYTAHINEQKISNVHIWIAEFSNRNTYILSQSQSGWTCDELKKELSNTIGSAIEQELSKQGRVKVFTA